MMRGSLVSLIYDKALTLDSFAETTEFSPSSTLTLASTDVETIYNGLIQMHEVWSNLIEIAIAIYLLERQLGVACVMTVSLSLGKPLLQFISQHHIKQLSSSRPFYPFSIHAKLTFVYLPCHQLYLLVPVFLPYPPAAAKPTGTTRRKSA